VAAKARGYALSEDGAGVNPFEVFEEYARAWFEGGSTPEPDGTGEPTALPDTAPEPDTSGPDFPDLG
jgi:hypothetical protein